MTGQFLLFPQELVDEMLDHLDHVSLKTCSLVCRAWLARSRSHVFGTCSLDPTNILGFRDLLQSSGCTFIPHVRRINSYRAWENNRCFDEMVADLRRLARVHTLDIFLDFKAFDGAADALFRTGFITAFPQVTHLILGCDNVSWPAPLFDTICIFPALQELRIQEMTLDFKLTAPPVSAVPPLGLHHLQLDLLSTVPILGWLHAFNRLSGVDSLTLPLLQRRDGPAVRRLLQELGGNLYHLDIALSWSWKTFANPATVYDLSLHPNLKTLAISDYSEYPLENSDPNPMTPFITRLTTPALECFLLDLHLSMYQNMDWAALDEFFSPARLPRLRTVLCRSRGDQTFLRGALPILRASGVLWTERL
ncbi:hypothetical protein MVEN_00237700 [Mycena venus]|uniref:F-box domain-containing protein n=1 Tax=Mycena venus TaxID=2733690 RepID=A0A8H6YXX6_9AGAR|nr:hypothetical protein MVEN_00237700 [Mycena venus]